MSRVDSVNVLLYMQYLVTVRVARLDITYAGRVVAVAGAESSTTKHRSHQ